MYQAGPRIKIWHAMRFKFSYLAVSAGTAAIKSLFVKVFTVAGNTILDVVLYWLMNTVFLVPAVLAQLISYTVSAFNRYLAYKFIKIKGPVAASEFLRFVLVHLVIVVASAEILAVLRAWVGMSDIGAKMVVTLFTLCANAFFYGRFVFRN